MAADVVIFYGPPHCGKSLYYAQHLSETHDRLCPSAELQQHPDLTLRQLILTQVIAPLKQGRKIVIDDENGSFTKRDSYICLVNKKLPGRTVQCVSFSPQHGLPQLLWSREFSLAARVENNADTSTCCHLEGGRAIDKWMNDKSALDPPRMTEGYEAISEIKTPFQVQVRYKLEWPVLLVQWEALVRGLGLDRLTVVTGAADTLTVWSQQNPAGRIVVLVDHTAFDTGTLCDRDMAIQTALKSLTKTVCTAGVYALHVRDVSRSGAFSAPPAPGLVAFLQRLLDLQLIHKASVYAYHTPAHMRMAEQAGIKHIKASRLFNRPALAKGSHAFTTVPIPALLKQLKVVPEQVEATAGTGTAEPSLPLSELTLPVTASYYEASVAPYVKQRDVGCGRVLYLSAQNKTVFDKYAELCAIRATCASVEAGSQSAPDPPPPTTQRSAPRQAPPHRPGVQRQESIQRDLPGWMKPKEDTKRDYKPKLKTLTSRTMYVMTSDELLATARHVLAEGLGTSEDQDAVQQPQPTSKQKPSQQILPDTAATNLTPTKNDQTISITNIDPPRVKNNDLNTSKHNASRDTKPTVLTARTGVTHDTKPAVLTAGTGVTQDTFKFSHILDDLFDDAEYGVERRPAPTQRRGKGRQSHMHDYLSPTKRKRTSEKPESTIHTAAQISTPTKARPSARTPTKQVKLEKYVSMRADNDTSVPCRPGKTIKMENFSPTRTDKSIRTTSGTATKPTQSDRGTDARSSPSSRTTVPIKSENFTLARANVRNSSTYHGPTEPIKSEHFFSAGPDTKNSSFVTKPIKSGHFFSAGSTMQGSSSFTTNPIKSEYYVPETTSVEDQEDSLVLVDTQEEEDSVVVADTQGLEEDSIVLYDSEEDALPTTTTTTTHHSGRQTAFTNLKQRNASRALYSVTTIPETTESARKSYH